MKKLVLVGILFLGFQAQSAYDDVHDGDYMQVKAVKTQSQVVEMFVELAALFLENDDSDSSEFMTEQARAVSQMDSAEFNDYKNDVTEDGLSLEAANSLCSGYATKAIGLAGLTNAAGMWQLGVSVSTGWAVFVVSMLAARYLDSNSCESVLENN